MNKKFIVQQSFCDIVGMAVPFGVTISGFIDHNEPWHEVESNQSLIYVVTTYDLDSFCTLMETKCESYLPQSQISPAIRNWLSTLPKPG